NKINAGGISSIEITLMNGTEELETATVTFNAALLTAVPQLAAYLDGKGLIVSGDKLKLKSNDQELTLEAAKYALRVASALKTELTYYSGKSGITGVDSTTATVPATSLVNAGAGLSWGYVKKVT
ncbi:MAG: hypothetical protein KAG14_03020, partial [Mycoplasmataceae bacterium]|nr:hypothetical protein [Mycoplasmataceae bacterium]